MKRMMLLLAVAMLFATGFASTGQAKEPAPQLRGDKVAVEGNRHRGGRGGRRHGHGGGNIWFNFGGGHRGPRYGGYYYAPPPPPPPPVYYYTPPPTTYYAPAPGGGYYCDNGTVIIR